MVGRYPKFSVSGGRITSRFCHDCPAGRLFAGGAHPVRGAGGGSVHRAGEPLADVLRPFNAFSLLRSAGPRNLPLFFLITNKGGEAMRISKTQASRRERRVSQARRRTVIGFMGAAALLPERWTAPVVQAVVLPAHAQTSPVDTPPEETGIMFAACSVTLAFTPGQVGIGGCTGGQFTNVIPTVSGAVVGDGDLSGIAIDIESVLMVNGFPQTVNGSTTTDGGGNYTLELDGLAPPDGVGGPHIVCTQDCGTTFPVGGLVQATVTSDDPQLAGTSNCSASFVCDDLV